MGYRTYIGTMAKREYNKIKSLTANGLYNYYKDSKNLEDESDFYIGVYEFGEKLHEFGKYTNFEPPKKSMLPFFKKPELKERYSEYDFFVVTKEFLAYLIGHYQDKIKSYYNEMIGPFLQVGTENRSGEFLESIETDYTGLNNKYKFDFSKITDKQQTALYKIINHVRDFRTEWVHLTPFVLDSGESITSSWKYEYNVFELVRIYKSFDWKRNVMIYYGF